MTTQPTSLTQYILHLLQDAGNREKFNQLNSLFCKLDQHNKIIFTISSKVDLGFQFEALSGTYLREIIRIALVSLDEFQKIIQTPLNVAEFFHDTYENQAPSFGYETRKDTKKFDKNSPNGQLMQAVCTEIMQKYFIPKTLAEKYGPLLYKHSIKELDEMFKEEGIII